MHTTRDTAASIVEQRGADYLMTVKQNCPETYQALATMPWEQASGRFKNDAKSITYAYGITSVSSADGLAPANRATCNNLVLPLILNCRRWDNAAAALRYFTLHRKAALQTLLSHD